MPFRSNALGPAIGRLPKSDCSAMKVIGSRLKGCHVGLLCASNVALEGAACEAKGGRRARNGSQMWHPAAIAREGSIQVTRVRHGR